MYSFFVLGLIPGTNFQITFQVWFDMVELLVVAYGLIYLHRLRHATADDASFFQLRRSMPATQLHQGLMASNSTWRSLRAMMIHSRNVIIERSVQFYKEYYPPMYED